MHFYKALNIKPRMNLTGCYKLLEIFSMFLVSFVVWLLGCRFCWVYFFSYFYSGYIFWCVFMCTYDTYTNERSPQIINIKMNVHQMKMHERMTDLYGLSTFFLIPFYTHVHDGSISLYLGYDNIKWRERIYTKHEWIKNEKKNQHFQH